MADPVSPTPGPRPLDGVRVLDLTRVLSGPHSTRMLRDLGADVIKVEPPTGDTTRFATPKINGVATYFAQQNVGKHNISLDMNKPEALEILLALADQCDVLVENFRPGVVERMGLGYEAVSARNPRIVYASISGYGQTGPWVGRRAYAPVVQAEIGFTSMQGAGRGGVPANDTFSHADVYTGMECCAGILAALFQRERTGRGDHIDVSMAQTMLYVNEHVHNELWDGPVDPNWIRSFGTFEYPVLVAANGDEVIIAGHPAENGIFEGFMRAAGRGELVDEPRMQKVASRREHIVEIEGVIRDWAATMPDAESIEEVLSAHKLATGQLRTVREVCSTDWAAARDVVVETSDRGGGTFKIPNSPWRFAGSEHGISGNVRYRGEDNHAVLRDRLGFDDRKLAELDAAGVLSSRVPDNATS
ncbi:MAG: putative CoA-transferase [Ilumatobacteraceae bacterium]|nr:putative CoA-transferase [Ilumatobacteraceae bacterium]